MKELKGFPRVVDCKPGLWVELTNGWIVGPIVETEYPLSICVKFGNDTWQVDVSDDNEVRPPDPNSPTFVRRVGTREALTKNP